jgi:hypothetical protein
MHFLPSVAVALKSVKLFFSAFAIQTCIPFIEFLRPEKKFPYELFSATIDSAKEKQRNKNKSRTV